MIDCTFHLLTLNGYNVRGDNSAEWLFKPPFWKKGSTLKGKNLSSFEQFLSSLNRSFKEEDWCTEKQTRGQNVISFVKMAANLPSVSIKHFFIARSQFWQMLSFSVLDY